MLPQNSGYTPTAPVEIWRLIFHFALTTPDLHSGYTPFQATPFDLWYCSILSDQPLRTNASFTAGLVLVCKHWRALASEFLYEDVLLQDSLQTRLFLDVLKRSTKETGVEGLGRYVRRLQLPSINVNNCLSLPTEVQLVDIINCCTNLEILIKPPYCDEIDDFRFWCGLTTSDSTSDGRSKLASLKRLDWFPIGFQEVVPEIEVQRLTDLIRESPNLRHLSLSGNPADILLRIRPTPRLTTLQFELVPIVDGMSRQDVSELTTLIAQPFILYSRPPLLDVVGQQLRTIELKYAHIMGISTRDMEGFFKCCPNLLEFNFHLGLPYLSELRSFQHLSITCIRMQVDRHPSLVMAKLLKQLDVVAGRSFPALKRVVLHGSWSLLLETDSFQTFRENLFNRCCTLEYIGDGDDSHQESESSGQSL